MRKLMCGLAVLWAVVTMAAPAPYPITVNSRSQTAPPLLVYAANEAVIRASFVDGSTASDLSTNAVPFLNWATNANAQAISTSTYSVVSSTGGVVDFTFDPTALNYNPGSYIYEVGCKTTTSVVRVYRQGTFQIQGSPSGQGVAPIRWQSVTDGFAKVAWVVTYVQSQTGFPAVAMVAGDLAGSNYVAAATGTVAASVTAVNEYVTGVSNQLQTVSNNIATATNACVQVSGDTMTGLLSVPTLTSTGATQLATSGGSVGIGTNLPAATLHVGGSLLVTGQVLVAGAQTNLGDLIIETNGISVAYFTATGNVGLATSGGVIAGGLGGGALASGMRYIALGGYAGSGMMAGAAGNDWVAIGQLAGWEAIGDEWLALGNDAGTGSSGYRWNALGSFTSYDSIWSNSTAVGNWAGRQGRGVNQFHADAYGTNPSLDPAWTGSSNDAVYINNGYVSLGRGLGTYLGGKGGELRGRWHSLGGLTVHSVQTNLGVMVVTGNTYLATSGGNVGIGTNVPDATLHVVGGAIVAGTQTNLGLVVGGLTITNQAITFQETDYNNFGVESETYPVASQRYSHWFGYGALANSPGLANTGLGRSAGRDSAGDYNTSVGQDAGGSCTGSFNMAAGLNASYAAGGWENVSIGSYSRSQSPGSQNTSIGHAALYQAPATGRLNTALGYRAGHRTGGSSNVFIGANAAYTSSATAYLNAICVGAGAMPLGDNSMVLGNEQIVTTEIKGNVGIGTNSPAATLHVNGSLRVEQAQTNAGALNVQGVTTLTNTTMIGNLTMQGGQLIVGTNAPSADDTAILICRNATNPLATSGSHALRDESTYIPTASGGYASFDSIPAMEAGPISNNHLHCFQARPSFAGTNIKQIIGHTMNATIGAGSAVDSVFGLRFYDSLGAGPILTQTALHVDTLTRGTENYAIYSGSTNVQSYHGGLFQFGTNPRFAALTGGSYGSLLSMDASGYILTNPNATLINGVVTFKATTARLTAYNAPFELVSSNSITMRVKGSTNVTLTSTAMLVDCAQTNAGTLNVQGVTTVTNTYHVPGSWDVYPLVSTVTGQSTGTNIFVKYVWEPNVPGGGSSNGFIAVICTNEPNWHSPTNMYTNAYWLSAN
jgi:hypothetical protein